MFSDVTGPMKVPDLVGPPGVGTKSVTFLGPVTSLNVRFGISLIWGVVTSILKPNPSVKAIMVFFCPAYYPLDLPIWLR